MEQSKPRGREHAMSQAWGSQSHEESQLPIFTGPNDTLAMNHQAGATENRDDMDRAHTADAFHANTNTTQVAQAVIDHRPNDHQIFNMESTKTLLRNFLDDMKGRQTEWSSYFDGLLSQWLDMLRTDRTYSLLIYILGNRSEHYGDRIPDFNDLETIDKIKARFLEQQCLQRGVSIHMAKMTSIVNTDPKDPLGLKMAVSLHETRNFSGGLLGDKPVAVGSESILQKGRLQERYYTQKARQNPYPSPIEGPPYIQTGTASFEDWVLLIMPEGYNFKFLTDNAHPRALHDWIQAQSADLELSEIDSARANPNLRWGLALACKTQLNNTGTWLDGSPNFGDAQEQDRQREMLGAVIHSSLELRDPDLFQKAITLSPWMLSLAKWEMIGQMMELANFFSYQNSLSQALSKIDSLQDRYIILHDIRVGCETQNEPQENLNNVHNWIQDQVEQALNDVQRVDDNDGAILVMVGKKYTGPTTLNRIMSFAKKHSSNQAFTIEFAFSLYGELVDNTIDAGFARYALGEMLSIAVPALCLQGAHKWSLFQDFPSSRLVPTSAREQQTLQAERMARLLSCCITVGLYNEENALLRHTWFGASVADAPTLQHVFLPYLRNLLNVMRNHYIPLTTQSYQWQFQQVISLFITRYIGKEPPPLTADFTCPPLGCASPKRPYGCPTCLELDAFLVDPHRKTADVTGGIDAPEHITAQIQGTDHLQMKVMSHSAEQMKSTIRITKIVIKSEEPDARHDLWKERVIKANEMIQAICGDEEWKMLLADRYDECMGLKAVRAG